MTGHPQRGISGVRRLFRRRERAPKLREGFETYALHGDNLWGCSITWDDRHAEHDHHHRRVVGWVSPRPRVGDRLLVKMESGRWGIWVFTAIDYYSDPSDMFHADVVGAIGYAEDDEVPVAAYRNRGIFV